jgi:hypothetical protein
VGAALLAGERSYHLGVEGEVGSPVIIVWLPAWRAASGRPPAVLRV